MEEITNEVYRVPDLVPLFLAAVAGAAASLKGQVKPFHHNKPMSETSDLKSTKEKEAAFLKIIDENHRIIHKICRAYSNTRADEEDLYQEIVYQLWKAYPTFKGNSKISTWMFSVALRSAILPFRRSRRPRIEYRETLPDRPSGEDGVHEGADDRLFSLFHRLGNLERAVLVLMMEGFNHKEIGAALGLGEEALTRRMSRVRKAINND